MTDVALDPGLLRDLYVAMGRNWTTAAGQCAYRSSHLYAGFGWVRC